VKAILVGNKLDLFNTREIAREEGLRLAKRLGMAFMEASALSGENINHAFVRLAKTIHKEQKLRQSYSVTPRTGDSAHNPLRKSGVSIIATDQE
jgi:GTPase SAR1 family protein